jgi:hypothetical protein
MIKHIHLPLFIFSLRSITASRAESTGSDRFIIAALLAVDCCVPNVIIICAGNCPAIASSTNIFRSLSFRFLFAFTSLYTNGIMNIVASSIGIKTVLKAPTWSCTSLMQTNCKDHMKLQANNAPHEISDFFIPACSAVCKLYPQYFMFTIILNICKQNFFILTLYYIIQNILP